MKNIKRAKTELSDRGFSQKIADKYTNLQLFSTNFLPVISTRRIIPRMRWLELVYAMPYVVLRREIMNSFKKTKNVLTSSAKQIWNIFLRFEFPLSRHREIMKIQDPRSKIQVKPVSDILYPVSSSFVNLVKSRGFYFKSSSMELTPPVSPETTGLEMEKESTIKNYLLPVVMHQPLTVIHKPPAVHYQKSDYHPYAHVERETSLNGQRIISQLNLKTSSMERAQPVGHETATARIETEKESAVTNCQLPVVTRQLPVVSHKSPAVSHEDQYTLSSTSDFITPLFSYHSFKPTFFLSQKAAPVKQRGASSTPQKSDAAYRPYEHVERETSLNGQRIISQLNLKTSSMERAQPVSHETTGLKTEKESTIKNYLLPVVMHQPLTVSYKPPAAHYQKSDYHPYAHLERETSLNGQRIFSQLNLKPSSMELAQPVSPKNTSEVEKAPIYHTYPEIEHVTSTRTEVLKERVIEKEVESKPQHATPQLPLRIDVNRLADQVYTVIERKIRIEKERRGFYG